MKLVTKHLFPFIRMITKLDIKDELKEFVKDRVDVSGMTEEEAEVITKQKGLDFVFMLLEKIPNAEKEVYNFLATYTNKSVEEIEEQDLSETIEQIQTLFKDPLFSIFFEQAVK